MSNMNKVIFLTGATGLVGRNLTSRLLQWDDFTRLILLIRGDCDAQAVKRFEHSLGTFPSEIDADDAKRRIQVVRGDITRHRLGLSESRFAELASEVTHIIHSAATVQFHLPLECARLVNCSGTGNVTALARRAQRAGRLERFGYISTAYVCGNRTGTILEEESGWNQDFANTYEQTKFESERFLRGLMDQVPITIFRPSIIVGDSVTGQTTAFNVLYVPLKLIYRRLIRILPGFPHTPIDVVPVDFVSDAISHILLRSSEGVGRTYHLTAGEEKATTAGQIVDLAVGLFNETITGERIRPVRFMPPKGYHRLRQSLGSRARQILQAMETYEPYLCVKRAFDNTNTRVALQGTNVTVPKFETYYRAILGYCIQTDWGRHLRSAA